MKAVKFGSILTAERGFIVHGCNAQGIMGGGLALAVRQQYPQAFEVYSNHIKTELANGRKRPELLGDTPMYVCPNKDLAIVNAITQLNYGIDGARYVNYEAIHKAFTVIAQWSLNTGLPVHYPLIGAGLGGGDWGVISDIIDSVFSSYDGVVQRYFWLEP